MSVISEFYHHLLASHGVSGVIILAVISLSFLIELYYYVGLYGSIPVYKNKTTAKKVDGVSVVMVVNQNENFISEILPLFLSQDYPNYQILLVDLVSNDEFSQSLQVIADNNPKVNIIAVAQKDERFKMSNKLALNIGIKSAKYDNIILSTVNAMPRSNKWLSAMARGFTKGDVVISYCGLENGKGFRHKMIACSKLAHAMKYLSAAIRNKTYRGNINNLGFTKTAYFNANGFNFLNLNMGEDDLFVQKLVKKSKTSVIMNPSASISQKEWGKSKWWFAEMKFHSATFKFYPPKVKTKIKIELFNKALFSASAITIMATMPIYYIIYALCLFIFHSLIVWLEAYRISRRLGDKDLSVTYIIYDLCSPFLELWLWLLRIIKPSQGVWR